MSVSNIAGKRMDGFSWNIQDMLGRIPGTIWKIWGLVCLTLCRQGFFLYVFKEIRVCEQHYGKTNKRITGFDAEACWPLNGPLFSSLNPLYSLMVVGVTGPPRVLQAISSVMEFHDFLKEISDMRQRTLWNILGILRITLWIRDRFFHLLDPCLLVISRENGWTDFYEIFIICQGQHHAHPFRSTSERSGAHMYHLFIDEIVEN